MVHTENDGANRIFIERRRQIEEEHYSAVHDDSHVHGEIALAAIAYAAPERVFVLRHSPSSMRFVDTWPWEEAYDKRQGHDRLRRLEIAGALIAAEIDRLLRLRETVGMLEAEATRLEAENGEAIMYLPRHKEIERELYEIRDYLR